MKIENKNLDAIKDITILPIEVADRVRSPELVAQMIGASLRYSATIESEVAVSGRVAEVLLPNMDPELRNFFDHWYPQEEAHGLGQMRLLENLGLEAIPQAEEKTSKLHRFLGQLAQKSELVHDAMEALVMASMAAGEYETIAAYSVYVKRLVQNDELELARMFGAYTLHERKHFNFQDERAKRVVQRLGVVANLPGNLLRRSYTPVGVASFDTGRAFHFGKLIDDLTIDRGEELARNLTGMLAGIFPNIDNEDKFMQNIYSRIQSD